MILKRLWLALALATIFCAPIAHAASTIEAPAGSGQRYEGFMLIDPTTGQPYAAGGGGGGGGVVYGPTANGAAPSGTTAQPLLNGYIDGSGLARTVSPTTALPTTPVAQSYALLTNASATGASTPGVAGGGYCRNISGTFGGASVQLTQSINGVTSNVGSPVTSAPASPFCFTSGQGTIYQDVITGGAGTSLTDSLNGTGSGSAGGGSSSLSNSASLTNPTSTLTLTSATTAYALGNLIANSATAGSVVVPSFNIANAAGGAYITRLRLALNDATSTGWGSTNVRIDLWTAAPTFTNGDRAAYLPATGTANHIGAYSCPFSAVYGDGVYAECFSQTAPYAAPKLASGTAIYWTATAASASGVTGASKVMTLTAELAN